MVDLASLIRPLRSELTPAFIRELGRTAAQENGDVVESSRKLADTLLHDALEQRATDIHLDPRDGGMRVRFRIDGALLDVIHLSPEQGGRVLRHFKATSGMDVADRFHPADARLTYRVDDREIDLRLASLPSICGEKMSIRLLDRSRVVERLDQLGFSDDQRNRIEQWLAHTCGMFLVAGPTGSGKTTTLYALLHELKLHERCVITVEEPVEYHIDGITQAQVHRGRGLSFETGLRAMLRADPDYLLLGEIRDSEAASAAIEASGSGRVLMSTIHAPDAIGTVTALRNFGIADHQIASSLRIVVAQRLVRHLCQHCRRAEKVTDADRQWLASVELTASTDQLWLPIGCEKCRNLGYDGRIGVFEVWRLTDEDYDAVVRHADERSLRQAALSHGLHSLLVDGWEKVAAGITTLAELRLLSATYHFRTPAPQRPVAGSEHALHDGNRI